MHTAPTAPEYKVSFHGSFMEGHQQHSQHGGNYLSDNEISFEELLAQPDMAVERQRVESCVHSIQILFKEKNFEYLVRSMISLNEICFDIIQSRPG